jgi:hypothetical protein
LLNVTASEEAFASILPRGDGGGVSGWLPVMSRAVSGLAVA